MPTNRCRGGETPHPRACRHRTTDGDAREQRQRTRRAQERDRPAVQTAPVGPAAGQNRWPSRWPVWSLSSVEAHLEQILALAGAHVLPTPGRAISVKTFRGQLPDDAENVTEAVAQAWRGLRPVTLGG